MSKTVNTKISLLISFFSLYTNIQAAAYRVARAAEQAYAERDYETVGIAGSLLVESGLPAYVYLGHYYIGLALLKADNLSGADQSFIIAGQASEGWLKERAALSRGHIAALSGNPDEMQRVCERLESSTNLPIAFQSKHALAVLDSLEGKHQRAMLRLQDLFPLASQSKGSWDYYSYLNSFAVELSQADKLEEAARLSSIVLSGPYNEPEFKKTDREITSRLSRPAQVSLNIYPQLSLVKREIIPIDTDRRERFEEMSAMLMARAIDGSFIFGAEAIQSGMQAMKRGRE